MIQRSKSTTKRSGAKRMKPQPSTMSVCNAPVQSKPHLCGRGFAAIRLDNGVTFFASKSMIEMGVAQIEQEKREGLLHPDVHAVGLALNCQAWALMQRPIAGEA